jgi:4-hydroxybenzoate polyprenyltransferase
LITTLLALLLTSSASMVVNDYYDCKLGRDEEKLHKSPSGQLLLRGDVPLRVARRFLNYLYAMSLLVLVVVPGIPTRLSVAVGLMLTYYYTQKLKPVCWVKNIVCACLIALSPLTSGTAAVHLITTGRQAFAQSLSIPSLWRLVSVLFFGVLGREVAMDCNDCASDERSGIRTVPVVHGRRYAASVALVSNAVVAFFAVGGPLLQILRGRVPLSCTVRRLALASIGSAMMLRRSYQVLRSECSDEAIVNRAVNEGLLTVIFFLASFI